MKDPINVAIFIFILLIVTIGIVSLLRAVFIKKSSLGITEEQIKVQRGDDILIVNSNGLVEYHYKDNVFYETWDSGKISSFFSSMEAKAKQYAKNKSDCKYQVTMYINGRLTEFCIGSGDKEMDSVFNDLDQSVTGGSISEFFDPDETEDESGNEDLSEINYFPTPSSVPTVNPTPTTQPAAGGQTNYPPIKADCETWSSSIVRNRAIISNTYCTVLPTPTP